VLSEVVRVLVRSDRADRPAGLADPSNAYLCASLRLCASVVACYYVLPLLWLVTAAE